MECVRLSTIFRVQQLHQNLRINIIEMNGDIIKDLTYLIFQAKRKVYQDIITTLNLLVPLTIIYKILFFNTINFKIHNHLIAFSVQ